MVGCVQCKAGIGIAMGNASADVKANTGIVAAEVDKDGILKSLNNLNII